MRKDRQYSAMLWINALAILVFGAGLLLLAFYVSFEAGIIASILAGAAAVAIIVTVLAVRAVKRHKSKERGMEEAPAEEVTVQVNN